MSYIPLDIFILSLAEDLYQFFLDMQPLPSWGSTPTTIRSMYNPSFDEELHQIYIWWDSICRIRNLSLAEDLQQLLLDMQPLPRWWSASTSIGYATSHSLMICINFYWMCNLSVSDDMHQLLLDMQPLPRWWSASTSIECATSPSLLICINFYWICNLSLADDLHQLLLNMQ